MSAIMSANPFEWIASKELQLCTRNKNCAATQWHRFAEEVFG